MVFTIPKDSGMKGTFMAQHFGPSAILVCFAAIVAITGLLINEGCYRFFKQPYIRLVAVSAIGLATALVFLSLNIEGKTPVRVFLEALIMIVVFTPISYLISEVISKHQRPSH